MKIETAKKIQNIYNVVRLIILFLAIFFMTYGLANAQTATLSGILRGKYEYEPDLESSSFEVRNARLAVSGKLKYRSEYKMEIDLCDETEIKMKDAWVRLNPWNTLRLTIGQQRMPFSIDAHRNPLARYFANRSFIAKQVGDMRDVGSFAEHPAPADCWR